MRRVGRELELKFALSGDQLERLKAKPSQLGIAVGKPVTQTLRSVYFDTPDRALHEHGLTLRLRRVAGAWHQTVKAETGVLGGVSHPIELETIVRARKPDLAAISDRTVRRQLRKAIGQGRLAPVFETVVKRTQHHLKTAEGGEVELAFDKGEARANGRSIGICEAEIELKSGTPRCLLSVVDEVLAGEQLKLSEHSKSEIGYGLVANQEWPKIEPLKSAASAVQRNDSSGEALERTLQAVIRQVLHNWQAVLVSEDPEAVHQMRIGLRRLRTALQVFRPLIKSPFVDDVERSVRDVAHLVGRLRDADVLASDIVAPLEAHSGPSASLQPLLELVAERRGVMRQQVRTKLASAEMVGLQLRLALLPAIAADPSGETRRIRMSRPATAFSAKALAKCWKKVARQGRHLDELSDEERHELRKDLKTLRYAVECCSPLYPAKKVARFVKKLQKLQELFGYLNDVVLAQDLAQAAPEGKWAGAEMQRAAGYVIGWHTAHAEDTWQTARAAWKKLKDTGRFWE